METTKKLSAYQKLKALLRLNKPVRYSNIKTFYGHRSYIDDAYNDLVHKENIHITSVSVTCFDNTERKYNDIFMIAISYDYFV